MGPLCKCAKPLACCVPMVPPRADLACRRYGQVPVRVDYSDLYDVLAFFDGGVDAARSGNHDDLAEEIAHAGADWARKHWRIEDMRVCKALPALTCSHSLCATTLTLMMSRRHAPIAARMGARIRPGQGVQSRSANCIKDGRTRCKGTIDLSHLSLPPTADELRRAST